MMPAPSAPARISIAVLAGQELQQQAGLREADGHAEPEEGHDGTDHPAALPGRSLPQDQDVERTLIAGIPSMAANSSPAIHQGQFTIASRANTGICNARTASSRTPGWSRCHGRSSGARRREHQASVTALKQTEEI